MRGRHFPANTRHSPNAVSMLAYCLRRWPKIEKALGECPVFALRTSYVVRRVFIRRFYVSPTMPYTRGGFLRRLECSTKNVLCISMSFIFWLTCEAHVEWDHFFQKSLVRCDLGMETDKYIEGGQTGHSILV